MPMKKQGKTTKKSTGHPPQKSSKATAPKKKIVSTKSSAKPKEKKLQSAPSTEQATTSSSSTKVKPVALLRGMKDILPQEDMIWRTLMQTAGAITTAYNFLYTETPILEEATLFVRSIGKGTDVVDKEMYMFEDNDGTKVALRPEGTAGSARAYIGHGMQSLPQPVNIWYFGPMFRHNRPQAGRFREFHQFGCESFGVRDAAIDAELINVAYQYVADLGIATRVEINSIGTLEDRTQYTVELVSYLRTKRSYLCDLCKVRINKNPLRVLDCNEPSCQPVKGEAPQIIDWLSETSKKYFMDVLEYLDELHIPYTLNPLLVRGLDYYTDTVFEIYADQEEETAQSALAGGGRYDGLVEQLGGPATPACGFSVGLERVASVLKARTKEEPFAFSDGRTKLFFAQLGTQASKRGLALVEELRKSGLYLHHSFGKSSLKTQLELANKIGVTHTLILGQKEVLDGMIIIRDMESGIQEIVDQRKIVSEVKKLVSV